MRNSEIRCSRASCLDSSALIRPAWVDPAGPTWPDTAGGGGQDGHVAQGCCRQAGRRSRRQARGRRGLLSQPDSGPRQHSGGSRRGVPRLARLSRSWPLRACSLGGGFVQPRTPAGWVRPMSFRPDVPVASLAAASGDGRKTPDGVGRSDSRAGPSRRAVVSERFSTTWPRAKNLKFTPSRIGPIECHPGSHCGAREPYLCRHLG